MAEIDSTLLRRITQEVAPELPGIVCRRLDVDPVAIEEAASRMALGQPPQVAGLVATALLVGVQAAREVLGGGEQGGARAPALDQMPAAQVEAHDNGDVVLLSSQGDLLLKLQAGDLGDERDPPFAIVSLGDHPLDVRSGVLNEEALQAIQGFCEAALEGRGHGC